MRGLYSQIKWQFLIFQRNNLVAMIFGITAFYMLVVYLLKDFDSVEKLVTLIIFTDTALISFIFIGFSIILEKNQEVISALFISPISLHFYLISKIIILSFICLFCAMGMMILAKDFSFNPIHFSIGTVSICIIFSFVGIYIVSHITEVLHYILRSIPVLAVMIFPVLNYFELTDLTILKVFPTQGGLYLITNSFIDSPNVFELAFGYISLSIWIPFLYWIVFKKFVTKLVMT